MKNFSLIFIGLLAFCGLSHANNVSITNISAPNSNTIQFDIAWDNSWYAGAPLNNWDAVWIFVKTQNCNLGSSPWIHANLSTVSGNHSVTGGVLQVDVVTDGRGIFLRRSALGAGNIVTATVTLQFSASYTIADTNYEVIGIEMVQVPEGSFRVGDQTSTNSFGSSQTTTPATISNEDEIAQDGLAQAVGGTTTHNLISTDFPKGFKAFYCMKYEISQQQYVTFLNLLDFNQQINRTAVAPSSAIGTAALAPASGDNRNSIEIATSGIAFGTPAIYGNDLNGNNIYDEATDGGNIACNYLSWDDLKAYLDWAALRPMTELEFEKSCRGLNPFVAAEYAWGTTTINQAISSSLFNAGQATEVSTSTADGLCAFNAGGANIALGPLRVGFAATASTFRTGAGASYYGILDLSGNVWEQTFTAGYSAGTSRLGGITFTGTLGDGTLDANGTANAANWGAVGISIVRGGNWEDLNLRARVSDRPIRGNTTTQNTTRVRKTGGRGVR